MNTQLATMQIRLNEWAEIIKDRCASGLFVDEYCKQHNLSRNAYYYWLRKVKAAALEQAGFVEIPLPKPDTPASEPSHFNTEMVIKTRGIELNVNSGTPAYLLAKALEVISHA